MLGPNGKIYGMPWHSEVVLIIDPVALLYVTHITVRPRKYQDGAPIRFLHGYDHDKTMAVLLL